MSQPQIDKVLDSDDQKDVNYDDGEVAFGNTAATVQVEQVDAEVDVKIEEEVRKVLDWDTSPGSDQSKSRKKSVMKKRKGKDLEYLNLAEAPQLQKHFGLTLNKIFHFFKEKGYKRYKILMSR